MTHLRRREFITVLGGAVIAWPGMSIAEGADGPRRVGVLMRIAEDDPSAQIDVQTFQHGLEKLGCGLHRRGRDRRSAACA